MIAGLTPQQIRDKLSEPGEQSVILAEVVCHLQWDGSKQVDNLRFKPLSPENMQLALQIMASKGKPDCSAAELYALACWCRVEHKLTQFNGRE